MRKSLAISAIMLLGLVVLTGWGQQTASSRLGLQRLLVNEKEVQAAFDSSWVLQAKIGEVNNAPSNTQFSAALIYGNGQTSLLTALFQFKRESQAHDYFATPVAKSNKLLLGQEKQDVLKKDFEGAAEVKLAKIRLDVRDDPQEDEQQLVLRFRVGQIVASYSIRLCIPAHPDPQAGTPIPYQCFNEAQLKAGLIKAGQTQLGILLDGR